MKINSKVIDVLICVAERDMNYLLELSIKSCISYFTPLNDIYIVTNAKEKLIEQIRKWGIDYKSIYVLDDCEVLNEKYDYLKGWYKQQLIKLHSDFFCKTKYICCLGADAVIVQPVYWEDLFRLDMPKLYYNRYKKPCNHLEYERSRLEGISDILQVAPEKAYLLGDFIMELMIFDRDILHKLRKYLTSLYGDYPFTKVINNITDDIVEGNKFGEWSLYSTFVLDVLHESFPTCNSRNEFVTQLHSESDLALYDYHSKIVHFVNKGFPREQVIETLAKYYKVNSLSE